MIASTSMFTDTAAAGPSFPPTALLPTKRAEAGYAERIEGSGLERGDGTSAETPTSRPVSPSTRTEGTRRTTKPKPSAKPSGFFATIHSEHPNKRLGGISNNTFSRMWYTFIALGVVVASWYLSLRAVRSHPASPDSIYGGDQGGSGGSSVAFIYCAFASAAVILVIFLERTVAQMRIERKAYKNPEHVLPRYNTYDSSDGTIAGLDIATSPNSRLRPLLLGSGLRGGTGLRGTSDEPSVPGPPPPAYGKTRGSVLLLRGIPELGSGDVDSEEGNDSGSSRRDSLRTPPGSPTSTFQVASRDRRSTGA